MLTTQEGRLTTCFLYSELRFSIARSMSFIINGSISFMNNRLIPFTGFDDISAN